MENNNLKQILIRYAICLGVATALVFGVLALRDFWGQTQNSQKIRYLSDAFSITGIMFMSFGALFFLTDEGSFDGIGWIMKSAIRVILPFVGTKDAETYRAYKERKHSKPKMKGYSCMFLTGLVCLIVGIVFMIIFNKL